MLWFTEPAFTSYGPKETAEKLIKSWNWSSKDATTKQPQISTLFIHLRCPKQDEYISDQTCTIYRPEEKLKGT